MQAWLTSQVPSPESMWRAGAVRHLNPSTPAGGCLLEGHVAQSRKHRSHRNRRVPASTMGKVRTNSWRLSSSLCICLYKCICSFINYFNFLSEIKSGNSHQWWKENSKKKMHTVLKETKITVTAYSSMVINTREKKQ